MGTSVNRGVKLTTGRSTFLDRDAMRNWSGWPMEAEAGPWHIANPSGDPLFSQVQLLMPMDTASDIKGATITTINGTPAFGSGVVNGAGDAGTVVSLNGGSAFSISSTNYANLTDMWTIEYWHFADTLSGERAAISHYVGGTLYWAFHGLPGDLHFFAGTGVSGWDILSSQAFGISVSTWHHIAVTYDGTNYRGFRDGTPVWAVASAVDVGISSGISTIVGRNPTSVNQFTTGDLDDIRITIGTARYTAGFTAPTAAFLTS